MPSRVRWAPGWCPLVRLQETELRRAICMSPGVRLGRNPRQASGSLVTNSSVVAFEWLRHDRFESGSRTLGGLLSFARPKESNQRKGRPLLPMSCAPLPEPGSPDGTSLCRLSRARIPARSLRANPARACGARRSTRGRQIKSVLFRIWVPSTMDRQS